MQFRGFKLLSIMLLLLLLFLQYRLWFESGGIIDMIRMKKQLSSAIQENEQLKKRNEVLLDQVKYLQKNQNEVESRARQDLGMIKKGETFYQVLEKQN